MASSQVDGTAVLPELDAYVSEQAKRSLSKRRPEVERAGLIRAIDRIGS